MSILFFVRLVAVLIAVPCFIDAIPESWTAWIESRLCHGSAIYEGYHSSLQTLGQVGACLTALIAIVLAFVAVPRFSWGASALSWCFLLLGLCLLFRLETGLATRLLCIWTQITAYVSEFYLALPPLIFGSFLRYRFVQEQIAPLSRQDDEEV